MPQAKSIHGQRTRRAILWTALAAIVLHVALTCWALVAAPLFDDTEYHDRFESYRTRWLSAKSAGRTTIAVVGSSRIEWGLRAGSIEETLAQTPSAPMLHNFGFTAAGPMFNWTVVRRLLASPAPPDCVVVEINPMIFRSLNGLPYETIRLADHKLVADERRALDRLGWKRKITSHWWNDLSPSWIRSRAEIFGRVQFKCQSAGPRDAWGDSHFVVDTNSAEKRERYLKNAKDEYFDALQNFQLDPTALAAMDDLLAVCRAKGVRVALLLMPEADSFREWHSAKTRQTIAEMLEHVGAGRTTACFDARTWLPEQTHFFDSHHLIDDGAQRFSRRLASECLMPWLADSPNPDPSRFQTTSRARNSVPMPRGPSR